MSTNTSTISITNSNIPITMNAIASGEISTMRPSGSVLISSVISLVPESMVLELSVAVVESPFDIESEVVVRLGGVPETGTSVVDSGVGDTGEGVLYDDADDIDRIGGIVASETGEVSGMV